MIKTERSKPALGRPFKAALLSISLESHETEIWTWR
jgi:hypothetical protein